MHPISSTGRKIAPALIFVSAWFVSRGVLELDNTGPTVLIFAALLPVAPFSFMLWKIIKGIRLMDELEQRIHLEALAIAFPLSLILLMTLGLLELAVSLPPEDLSYRHVWAFLPVFYFGGLAFARRRYQ
jgi:hypothetical protein